MARPRPQALTITEAAADRVKALIAKAEKPVIGLRIGVRARGCSGMSYWAEYAEDVKPNEEVIEDKGVRLMLEPSATLFLIGTEVDYEEGQMQSGFVFNNPNEAARCGCGESFTVAGQAVPGMTTGA